MKIKIFAAALLILSITGCQKKPEQANAAEPQVDTNTKAKFEESDTRISKFLDQLDDPNTTQEVRIQILCKDYPNEYKANYMPALIKLSPSEYTEGKLIKDLNIALDYYKSEFGIKCE